MPEKNQLDYTCGLSDDEITRRFKEAIRIDEEIRAVQGIPQARYDEETKRAYLEYADGRKDSFHRCTPPVNDQGCGSDPCHEERKHH